MQPLDEVIGDSPGIMAVREQIRRLLPRQAGGRRPPPILIQGETGTGKGLVARVIHRAGPRATAPFVDVNCAAIPETLLEAELFGYERGAFTDARQAKAGLFQTAHGGTIFLDEVGLLPEALQAKLLTVLEERAVRRLGATKSEPIDVAIITATNEDLALAMRERRFRTDLYHRLAVMTLALPPLRERGDDALVLADRQLARVCGDYGLPERTLSPAARAALARYAWPGNVRELSNVIERAALLADATVIGPELLALPEAVTVSARAPERVAETAQEGDEHARIAEALARHRGNVSRAAADLGLTRNTMRYRMEKHGLTTGAAVAARTAMPAAPPAAVRAPAPLASTPPAAAPAGVVRWERRRVALLRGRLRGAPAPGASDARRLLEVVVDKIAAFGGRVEELSPASFVAAFGLEPGEDAVRRAATAAMAIGKAGAGALVMAIHVAEIMVGRINGAVEIEHDAKRAILDTVDALLASAAPGVTVTSAAVPFLERHFELAAAPASVAGAFRVVGPVREGLASAGRMAPFVGRGQEIDLLGSRLAAAKRGQGQVVGIAGEAGIGKSRLLHEFRESVGDGDVVWVEGQCLSYASGVPYVPVLDLVRAGCGLLDADPPDVVAAKCARALAGSGLDATENAPYLLHLLGVKEGSEAVDRLGNDAIKARAFEILRQMTVRRSRRRPLVIALEDVHWIDVTSEEFFTSLVDIVPTCAVMLIATYRVGYRPTWIDRSYATHMALPALTPADSASVARSVVGREGLPEAYVQLIVSRAEGNPFFLEELARAAREEAPAGAMSVPTTVEEVILARLDRLPAADRRLLHAAAVVGKDVPFAILRAALEADAVELRAGLRRLQAGEFLYEAVVGAEPEYTFKHALTHEVVYGSVPDAERRALHARIVTALEAGAEGSEEHVERLAHHAMRGELWDRAAKYLRLAGRKALRRSAYREAVTCLEDALSALAKVPESAGVRATAVDLRFDLRAALFPMGEHARILTLLHEAETIARSAADEGRLVRTLAYTADCDRLLGEYDRAITAGETAFAIADRRGDFGLRVAAMNHVMQAHHDLGQFRRGAEVGRANVARLEGCAPDDFFTLPYLPSIHTRTWLVLCLVELGEFAEAATQVAEARRIAESVDHPFSRTSAQISRGRLHLRRGEIDQAQEALTRGLEIARGWNIRLWLPLLTGDLGLAHSLADRHDEALSLLRQSVEYHASTRGTAGQAMRVACLGHACVRAGRLDEAGEAGRQALALARGHHERGNEAYALRLLGDVALRGPKADRAMAATHYAEAIALAQEGEMRPLLARCYLALAAMHHDGGDIATADRHLDAGMTLCRALGMPINFGF